MNEIYFATGWEDGRHDFTGSGIWLHTSVPKTGTYALNVGSGSTSGAAIRIIRTGSTFDELYVSFWAKAYNFNTSAGLLIYNTATQFTGLRMHSSGTSYAWIDSVINAPGVIPLTVSTYHHFQYYIRRGNGTGEFKSYVDGHLNNHVIDAVISPNHQFDRILIAGASSSTNYIVDDLVIADDWPGDIRIVRLNPTADTAQKDWVPNAGSDNFSRVNDDSDASYVSAFLNGERDLYELQDWSSSGLTAAFVTHLIRSRQEVAGGKFMKPVLKSGSTIDVGDSILQTSAYVTNRFYHPQNPDTATPWDGASIDALQIGIEYSDV